MNRGIMSLALCALLLPSVSLADLRPDFPKKKEVPAKLTENVALTITYDKDVKVERATLKIPKKFMVAAGDSELVPMADASNNRMLFTGLALSAALVTGGLWFVRRSGKGARGIFVLFILSTLVTCAALLPRVEGDAGIRLPQIEIDGNKVKLKMDVVVAADGDRIELVLPGSLAPNNAPKQPGR